MIIKILHTSDWHLGRKNFERSRNDEIQKFLHWLINLIRAEKIDVLIIAGDIFNTVNPDIQSQELYYNFLNDVTKTNCKHVIIISGNHDSQAFLDAASGLLKNFNVHVIGRARKPQEELIILYGDNNLPEIIICAVPFLHDNDVRTITGTKELTKNNEDKIELRSKSLIKGIYKHYQEIFEHALNVRKSFQLNNEIPIIATGHLFVSGGRVSLGDEFRDISVGSLIQVHSDLFPEYISYAALGHLHTRQNIGRENICYSGSPIAMNFGEGGRILKKSVNIIEFTPESLEPKIKFVDIPIFRELIQIRGTLDEITEVVKNLECKISTWLEIILTERTDKDTRAILNKYLRERPHIEIVSVQLEKNEKLFSDDEFYGGTLLEDFSPLKIFELCLNENGINSPEQRATYKNLYNEILNEVNCD